MQKKELTVDYKTNNKDENNTQENKKEKTAQAPFFPLFVSLAGKPVVIIGAGSIALRRVKTLLHFQARLKVIAPEIHAEIQSLAQEHGFMLEQRPYQTGDCTGAILAVAATDDRSVNQKVAEECALAQIPVSVADNQAACTFFFPAIVKRDNLVIGVTSSGENHGRVKRVAAKLRQEIEMIDTE